MWRRSGRRSNASGAAARAPPVKWWARVGREPLLLVVGAGATAATLPLQAAEPHVTLSRSVSTLLRRTAGGIQPFTALSTARTQLKTTV